MATHKHHRCECKHAKVEFCGECKVVHCLDCKMEWTSEPCTKTHYPWGLVQSQSYTITRPYLGGVGGGTVGNTFTLPQRQQPKLPSLEVLCSHER